jgi:hypothetical protein
MADNDTKKEPQSYGSDKGWVSGKTGGTVDNQPQKSEGGGDAFYNPRRDNETSSDFQGGRISPEQLADNAASTRGSHSAAATTAVAESNSSGAQRESFFRARDYEEK